MAKSNKEIVVYNPSDIQKKIFTIRNDQVMLDSDLSIFYGVETKYLNRAVKRNSDRFPKEFMFQLKDEEWDSLRFQIVASNDEDFLRFQNGTLKSGRGEHRKYLPYVFTEQGVAMLSIFDKDTFSLLDNIKKVIV